MNFRFGCTEFRFAINVLRSSTVPFHIINISSMYLVKISGLVFCVGRNFFTIVDMYILATEGEKAAPIAVPFICWNVRFENSK